MTVDKTLQGLGKLVQQKRSRDHLSLRKAADEMEVSFNVIARLEQGKLPTSESLVKVMLWHPKTSKAMNEILSVLEEESSDRIG